MISRLIPLQLAVAMVASAAPVSFRTEIAPLLQRRCVTCHGEENAKGGYRLDSFSRLRKAGDSELPPLTAGRPQDSELHRLLLEENANDRMPQKADALPAAEIALLERWIAQGATYDGGDPDRTLSELTRASMLLPAPAHYARPAPVTAIAFSPAGRQLAVSGYREITVWNLDDLSLARRVGGLPERITGIAWHAKKNLIAVSGGLPAQWGGVALVDPRAGFQVRYLCDLPDTALCVAFSPDGSRLIAGATDRTIRIFDTASGKSVRVLRQHSDWVQALAFSPDGSHFVSASRDRTPRIFRASDGELERTYANHDVPVLTARYVGEHTILSLGRGKTVHTWSTEDSKTKDTFTLAADSTQMVWSRFGVITGGNDRVVRITQLSDERELFALRGHDDVITALAVAPDGQSFASGSADGTVCRWDVACGTWTQRFVPSP